MNENASESTVFCCLHVGMHSLNHATHTDLGSDVNYLSYSTDHFHCKHMSAHICLQKTRLLLSTRHGKPVLHTDSCDNILTHWNTRHISFS